MTVHTIKDKEQTHADFVLSAAGTTKLKYNVGAGLVQKNHYVIERFYSLDVLRGIAALSVVFWHWQHFFFSGTNPVPYEVMRLPLSKWLFVLYTKGYLSVDLFFNLSGFVFFWLYSTRIAEGAITPGKFALLRFSRLYPLHLATLLIVAVSQLWLLNTQGSYFVYSYNDSLHFLLNLLFASSWGIERCYASFNGPAWSVSVEILLYAIFFMFCRLFHRRTIVLAFISAIGFVVVQPLYSPIGRGLGSFFLGGCGFLAYQSIIASRHARVITKWAIYLMVVAWAVTFVITLPGVAQSTLSTRFVPFSWLFEPHVQWGIQKAAKSWPVLVLFPLTILALALFETHRGSLGKHISFLGDISYSSYLLHFPLQLLFSVLLARFAFSHSIYYSPWFMGFFFVVLIAISLGSFRYFEVPVQRFLRQSSLTRRCAGRADARTQT
jgi:peptidoglycan/LPS O-acetylase OafA/YrhL